MLILFDFFLYSNIYRVHLKVYGGPSEYKLINIYLKVDVLENLLTKIVASRNENKLIKSFELIFFLFFIDEGLCDLEHSWIIFKYRLELNLINLQKL